MVLSECPYSTAGTDFPCAADMKQHRLTLETFVFLRQRVHFKSAQ